MSPREYSLGSGPNKWTRKKPQQPTTQAVQRVISQPQVERAVAPLARKPAPQAPQQAISPPNRNTKHERQVEQKPRTPSHLKPILVRFNHEHLSRLTAAAARCDVSVAGYLRVLVDTQVPPALRSEG